MKTTFTVSIVNTKTQSRSQIVSNAVTLGELKNDLSSNGIDYDGMTFMEGATKVELKDDSSILPTNVPVKRNGVATGETTNDLVFFLTTPNKNIKSGAMSRAEVYAEIKRLGLQDACKQKYGRNFTQCSTDLLVALVEKKVSKPSAKKVVAKPVPAAESASHVIPDCENPVITNAKAFAERLHEVGILNDENYQGFLTVLAGGEMPEANTKYSQSDIDEMYGDWMKK